uniref:Peptide hormone 1 n=27 Tax=Blattoidea TaxID=1049657 RepID=PH1_PERAM|nr:RecName: Full=Peptide hormone 1; AltName: Full=Pea-SKNacid [Periplaneta americana]
SDLTWTYQSPGDPTNSKN